MKKTKKNMHPGPVKGAQTPINKVAPQRIERGKTPIPKVAPKSPKK